MLLDLNDIETARKVCYNFKEISDNFNITDDSSYKDFIRDNVDLSMGVFIEDKKMLMNSLYLMKIKNNEKFVFIDVPLVNAIRNLNENGFKTQTCCCGHSKGRDAYICFKRPFSENEMKIICDVFWQYDFYVKIKERKIIRWINKTDYKNYNINHCGKIDKVFNRIIELLC